MVLLQHLPRFRLGLLHPGDQVWRVEGKLAVVGSGAAFFVEPAVGAEVIADLALEGDLVVEAHELGSSGVASGFSPEQPAGACGWFAQPGDALPDLGGWE